MIKIPRLKEDQLKKLAVDFHHKQIFTDREVKEPRLIGAVFMPLEFMKWSKGDVERVGLIYEYLDKAGPRSINGMPMFMSCRILAKEDMPLLKEYVERLEKAEERILRSGPTKVE